MATSRRGLRPLLPETICTSTATRSKTLRIDAAGDRLESFDGEADIQRILIRVAINALALWAAAGIIDGISLQDGFWKVLVVAVVFGLVNAVLKPLLVILSIPFIVVTLGIALIVINALMLLVTDYFTAALTVDDFGSAVLGAIVISVVSWTAGRLLPDPKKRSA